MALYQEILQITLSHDYYTDGKSPDFAIIPLGDTAAILNRHRLLMRADQDAAHLLAPLVDGKVIITLDEIRVLHFGLELKNPAFSMFTDLPELANAYNQLSRPADTAGKIWTNKRPSFALVSAEGNVALAEQEVMQAEIILPVDIDTTETNVTFALKNSKNEIMWTAEYPVPQEGSAGRLQTTLDFSSVAAGLYNLEASSAPADKVKVLVGMEPCFRTLVLNLADNDLMLANEKPAPLKTYNVAFKSLKKKWGYHVTLTGANKAQNFKIVHSPDNGPAITFSDAVVEENAPTQKTIYIESKNAVQLQQASRSGLRLVKLSNNADVVENLPNPPPDLAEAHVRIRI